MSYSRRFDFKAGTKISPDQVDEEFNQLIEAVNKNEEDILIAEETSINFSKGFGLGNTAKDVTGTNLNNLNETGFYFANAVTGGQPTGITGYLYIINIQASATSRKQIALSIDSDRMWTRYQLSSTWQPWKEITLNDDKTNTTLWTGAYFLNDAQTVTPSKKLTECRNGWILVWSDYDPGTSTAGDYDYGYSYLPKYAKSGKAHLLGVPNFISASANGLVVKKVFVHDDRIVGSAENDSGANQGNDVVLRAILEW